MRPGWTRWRARIGAAATVAWCAAACSGPTLVRDSSPDAPGPPEDAALDARSMAEDSVTDRVDLNGPDGPTELDAAGEPLDGGSIPDATADLADVPATDAALADAGLSDTTASVDSTDVPETRDAPSADTADARDGVVADDGRDGADTGEPGWQRYTWTPSTCAVERAVDPAAVVPPLRWRPCADGRPGCQELVVDWATSAPSGERLMGGNAGWHDGVRGWLLLRQRLSSALSRVLIAATDGELVAAWRFPEVRSGPDCKVQAAALGDGMYAVQVEPYYTPDTFLWSVVRGELRAGATERIGPLVRQADQNGVQSWPQDPAVNRQIWAAGMAPALFIVRATDRFEIVSNGAPGGLAWHYPAVIGTNLLYNHYGYPEEDGGRTSIIALKPLAGPAYPLVHLPGQDAFGIQSDGRDMIWLAGIGYRNPFEYDRYELWTAPYTTDPAALQPRYVGPYEHSSQSSRRISLLGHGRVVTRPLDNSLRIYSLTDGSYWDLPPRANSSWGSVLYVGPDEFAVEDKSMTPDPVIGSLTTIVRQRYDALGPPLPAIPRAP